MFAFRYSMALLHVEGYDELQKSLQDYQGQLIFVLFSGSLGADGQSWCPDCVTGVTYKFSNCCDVFLSLTLRCLQIAVAVWRYIVCSGIAVSLYSLAKLKKLLMSKMLRTENGVQAISLYFQDKYVEA